MADVRRRIAMARQRHGKMRHVWKSNDLHLHLKLRLYRACVCSIMVYGAEGWKLNAETQRALNGANSQMLSIMTGKTIREEAKEETKTFCIIGAIRATRLRWAGHILRMDSGRLIQAALQHIYEHRTQGDLLMDAPATATWQELKDMASGEEG